MAERVGFEPTNTGEDVTEIPVQRLRPLGHLSRNRIFGHLGRRRREDYTAPPASRKRDSGGLDGFQDLRVILLGKRGQGQPDAVRDEAHAGQRPLGGDRVGLQE